MTYNQFTPHSNLTNYIDAYWTVKGDRKGLATEKILPDGCVDLIFNLGDDCKTDNGNFTMQNNKVYLVGTMTTFKMTNINPDTNLLGIRFKPAAFSAFYKFSSLHEITDLTIEFDKALSPDLKKTIENSTTYFNHYFLSKLAIQKHNLLPIIDDIKNHKGQTNVRALAHKHFTTTRQLERNFKVQIGISPKEFIEIVRFQFALEIIQRKIYKQSLLDIAFQCGYYDHAHLTNEIKRFSGVVPSQL